jgi:conjugal transfer ATP-binding protein TraC
MTNALADLLQIWGFQDNAVIFADGSLGSILELTPIDVSCWEDERVDTFAQRLGSFLNSLPAGVDIQFVQEIGTGNADIIDRSAALRVEGSSPSVTALQKSRLEWLRECDRAGLIPRHSMKLVLRRAGTQLQIRPRLLSKAKQFEEMTEGFLEREMKLFSQLQEEVLRGLKTLDLRARPLAEREIAEEIHHLWNPSRPLPLGQYDPEEVRSSLVFSDACLDDRGFSLGDVHHRIVSLKLLPDQTHASMARVLRGLPLDSKLFLSINVPDQQKEFDTLQAQRRIAFSIARGKKSGVSDIESEAKLQDLEELISELVSQGEKIFQVSLNILLRAKSKEELDDQAALALATIRKLSGAEGMEESLAAFDVFTELALPNARARERAKRMKTSNVTDFLPVYGPWPGHETPRVLLRSGEGSLIGFDPFSKELTNYNQIVTGGSGSGKSFLTNLLLLQMLKERPKVFIVDIGGSYKKLCENLDGQYIPFDLTSALSLNPFDLLPGETRPTSQKIKFLVGLVEMMTKEEDEKSLGRLERAEIEEAIQAVYDANNSPRLSHLQDRLLAHTEPGIRKFGRILGPWCGETAYGRLVDQPTTVALERGLVSFDLKGLDSYPDLQAVCLYLITDYVWREVQRDRGTMKFLVFDECWKLLENPAGSTFIGEVFRTFRKYYASAVAISQNIDDFAKSRVSGAILPNTSIKWVLMQKGADMDRLKEALHLNDNEIALISSLHQERGVYSQAFLMAEETHCLVAVEPTPLEYWMATTDPRDLARIETVQKQSPGTDSLSVLRKLAAELPRGVVASGGAA